MRLIAETIKGVTPTAGKAWKHRIVLGIWAAKYLPLARRYLPDFPITYIGFSLLYARQFLGAPDVSFNMMCPALQGPGGSSFIRECKALDRQIFAWTVNTEAKMDWCIRKGLDGVITDDPGKFLEVCESFDETRPPMAMSPRVIFDALRIWFFALLFASFVRSRLDRGSLPGRSVMR